MNPFGHKKGFRRIGTISHLGFYTGFAAVRMREKKRYYTAEKYAVSDERYHSAEGGALKPGYLYKDDFQTAGILISP